MDSDKECPIYSDDALDSQIDLTALLLNDDAYASTGKEFTATLTSQQQAIVSLECAIRILSGMPDDFSWKSPVLTVLRRNMKRDLLDKLTELLDFVRNGNSMFAIAVDTDFDAIVQSIDRHIHSLDNALTAWNGNPNG